MKEIKLRARLSAYSKIESLQELNETLPDPDTLTPGSSVVVSPEGDYVPMTAVTKEQIDGLFEDVDEQNIVTKEQIDTLFDKEQSAKAVSFADIDSLFN